MATDQGYLTAALSADLIAASSHLSAMISHLIEYLKGSGMKGAKFKKPPHRTMKEEMDNLLTEFSDSRHRPSNP